MTLPREPAAHCEPVRAQAAPAGGTGVLQALAARLAALHPDRRLFTAVDGVDGSGKTTFADALAAGIRAAAIPRPVVRVSLDDFHHRRDLRYRRGRGSAAGFRHDSYNLDQFRAYVLSPLRPGGCGHYRPAGHNLDTDAVLSPPWQPAAANAVVLVDGLFLHRDELAADWDFSIFLDVPFPVSAARMALRDGTPADPEHPDMHRYVGGQRLYFGDSDPAARATVVVENTDPEDPRVIPAAAASCFRTSARRYPGGTVVGRCSVAENTLWKHCSLLQRCYTCCDLYAALQYCAFRSCSGPVIRGGCKPERMQPLPKICCAATAQHLPGPPAQREELL
ncbi:hypothetical protein [Arthrobacter sp. UYP6]|uniref:hypothetical protein n=1 Tax=Arthrobacter sp. UYP6 TaxID=1756378 RepID=UPI003394D3C0